MYVRFMAKVAVFAAIAAAASAQTRRAAIVGGGYNSGQGRCTVAVTVDGVAEISIRGDSANLRDVSGEQPQWRRFECTSPLPANAASVQIAGVNGRGNVQVVRDPRGSGAAVIRIEDPESGASDYSFEITWNSGAGPGYAPAQSGDQRYDRRDDRGYDRSSDRGYDQYGDRDRQMDRYQGNDSARACEDAVRQQAANRFGGAELMFRRGAPDTGRGDMSGTFEVRGGNDRPDVFHYSCSTDDNGRIRARIEPMRGGQYGDMSSGRAPMNQACERAVIDRIRQDGYDRVEIGSMDMRHGGRGDRFVGTARADGEDLTFSCSVDMQSGAVRSVDVVGR